MKTSQIGPKALTAAAIVGIDPKSIDPAQIEGHKLAHPDPTAQAAAKALLGGEAGPPADVAKLNALVLPETSLCYSAPSPKSAAYAQLVLQHTLDGALATAALRAKANKSVPPTRTQVLLRMAPELIGIHHAIAEGYDENLEGKSPTEVGQRQTFSRALLAHLGEALWNGVAISTAFEAMPKAMGALLQVHSDAGEAAVKTQLSQATAVGKLRKVVGMIEEARDRGMKLGASQSALVLKADQAAAKTPKEAFESIKAIAIDAQEFLATAPEQMSKAELAEMREEMKAAKTRPSPKVLMANAKVRIKELQGDIADAPAPDIQARFRGSLVGLAIGDALGGPTEFMSRGQIRQKFGMVTDMIGGGWLHLEPGEYTDDTQMAVAMAESIVDKKGFDASDVADRFVEWLNTDPKDVGNLTRSSLELRRVGVDAEMSGKIPWQMSGFENAGNGSVMRAAPVALLTAFESKKPMTDAATASSAVSHFDGRCQWGTAAISYAVQGLMKGQDPAEIVDEVAEWLQSRSPDLAEAIAEVHDLALNDVSTSGYVVHTVQAAFWAMLNATDYVDGVLKVSNLGEDTDTAGATAGILLGARFGIEGIPKTWRDQLQNVDKLTSLADTIHGLATEGKS